jgi:hypothetical protein
MAAGDPVQYGGSIASNGTFVTGTTKNSLFHWDGEASKSWRHEFSNDNGTTYTNVGTLVTAADMTRGDDVGPWPDGNNIVHKFTNVNGSTVVGVLSGFQVA